MYAKNERLPSPLGIVPERLFLDRSSDSRLLRLEKDRGIWPVKALFDKLSAISAFKKPIDSGICPSSCCTDDAYFLRGVTCNNVTGAVTVLELPGGCLRGTLRDNSSLFELNNLRYLNLSFNNFASSPLPSTFGQLHNLEVLLLSSNGFLGQVPSSLRNLTKLTQLQLSHNKLTGDLTSLLQNRTSLVALDVSSNEFYGTIPSFLFTMPSLSFLDLSENHLSGSLKIPFSLPNLRVLKLSYLNITHQIDLRTFSSLKSLTYLDLSGNSLTPTSVDSDINFAKSLRILLLSECNISKFPRFVNSLKNLEFLYLSDNRIKGNVPDWLWSLPHLTSLNLYNNSFTGFEGSLDHVLANSSVQVLDMAYNCFNGSFPDPPLFIINLSAWNNSFTGEIPLSTCNRTFLDVLDLSYNNFTGVIPPCLGNINIVNLRKNKLEGNIPDEFHIGASTQTLDLGYNQLTGKLPRSLLNCTLLKFVSVDHNKINDSFPFWLKALPNLKVLTLRSNRFHGSISPPDGPLAFPKLQILEISHNRTQITGQPKSSFEGNLGLCGLPLEERCFTENTTSIEEDEEEEEGVLKWRAVAIGYGPGVLFGLVIGHVVALYRPEWFIKSYGQNRLRGIGSL
ncbi:hypothetical protein F2Q68_00027844 [Brassica cretica]|uniref:Disease resistance R13L4/SHOC-2-like LRR domain-containing protein n=1 Tax=Brassica cretica TaxID=69181 RepID=A0A8S9ICA5_BRACR|nr:hypothetical protein F2Q68_00027844 [Brassica cretica]